VENPRCIGEVNQQPPGADLSLQRRSIVLQNTDGLPLMPTYRYPLQPWDTVIFKGKRYFVKEVQNKGAYIKLDGLAKPVKTSAVKLLYYGKGLCVL